MDTSPNLALPYLLANQAQKHVTVNEALRRLDAANPGALMAGSDLPSTRAPARFGAGDLDLLRDSFAGRDLDRILRGNGAAFYAVDLPEL